MKIQQSNIYVITFFSLICQGNKFYANSCLLAPMYDFINSIAHHTVTSLFSSPFLKKSGAGYKKNVRIAILIEEETGRSYPLGLEEGRSK